MQCSMRNQCSGLFTCIMNYLYVLCMILMLLSCVLCITLMVFIYVYYRLFACTNLVDVMSLFSTVFSFHLLIFWQNSPGNRHDEFWENHQFISEIGRLITKTGRISVFRISTIPPSSPVCFG
jgi:hypothetical protein